MQLEVNKKFIVSVLFVSLVLSSFFLFLHVSSNVQQAIKFHSKNVQLETSSESENPKIFGAFKYDKVNSSWKQKTIEKSTTTKINKLTIISFNIWSSQYFKKERINQVFKLSKDADIICLQDVTKEMVQYLQTFYKIQNKYELSDINGDTINTHGVFILSKIPIQKFSLLKTMNQKSLIAHLNINDEEIVISNISRDTEFEDGKTLEQVKKLTVLLNKKSTSLMMGDFAVYEKESKNSGIYSSENDALKSTLSNYQDIWSQLSKEPGFTLDSKRNVLLKPNKILQSRNDRMYIKSKKWNPKSIKLIGDSPFMKDKNVNIFPSNHFGLMTTIEYQ